MKTWKIATITVSAFVVAALLASSAFAMGTYGGFGGMMSNFGLGMMGGYSYNTDPNVNVPGTTTPTQPTNLVNSGYSAVFPFQFGGGCMGRLGLTGTDTIASYTYTGAPLNITTAKTIAQNYIASICNPDLTVKHVEEYTSNFYVKVVEKSTSTGAFELLINKFTGSIYPEMGPNMMWNTKYGMMNSGILGGIYGTPTATTTVTATQAKTDAQQYLTTYLPGTTVGDATTFYGYYTIEITQGGTTYGMLSVNSYTGQIWYHNWHGTFIQEQTIS